MEHIQIDTLPNGYFRLTPDNGYRIFDNRTHRTHSVVDTKTPKYFRAVSI